MNDTMKAIYEGFDGAMNDLIKCKIDRSGAVAHRTVAELLCEVDAHFREEHVHNNVRYKVMFSEMNGAYNGYVEIPHNITLERVGRIVYPHGGFTLRLPRGGDGWDAGFDCWNGDDLTICQNYSDNKFKFVNFWNNDATFKTHSFVVGECLRIIDAVSVHQSHAMSFPFDDGDALSVASLFTD